MEEEGGPAEAAARGDACENGRLLRHGPVDEGHALKGHRALRPASRRRAPSDQEFSKGYIQKFVDATKGLENQHPFLQAPRKEYAQGDARRLVGRPVPHLVGARSAV